MPDTIAVMGEHRAHGPNAASSTRRGRVGLVLGGGGLLGGAWLVGALNGIAEAAAWDPRDSAFIVGTSAGSVVASMLACGYPVSKLLAHQRGEDVAGLAPIDDMARRTVSRARGIARPVLGSPAMALRTTVQPWKYSGTHRAMAWLGRGFLSTGPLGEMIAGLSAGRWPREGLWITAVDYQTGRRVVFGRDLKASLDQAVQASCAVPGLYRPVRINGRTYVDGGVWSRSNLDLLADAAVDIVVVLNPMSSLEPGIPASLAQRMERRFRASATRDLVVEASRIRRSGARVVILQPDASDLEVMGVNLMNAKRRGPVLDAVRKTIASRLKDPVLRDGLDALREAAATRGESVT